jgi:hypothetical protein
MERDYIGFSNGFMPVGTIGNFVYSSFWHFTRRRNGKDVPDTQTVFSNYSARRQ